MVTVKVAHVRLCHIGGTGTGKSHVAIAINHCIASQATQQSRGLERLHGVALRC